MNLILDPWIPIRDAAGCVRDISPLDLASTEPAALELAALRPDFNGAIAQFLIGLLQLVGPAKGRDWKSVMSGAQPFPVEALRDWSPDFEFDCGDRRVMQDMQVAEDSASNELDALLLESPGANAVRNNSDLFIKRRDASAFSVRIVAQALICLQINAPSGGQGHRTSLRGGGPVSYPWWPTERNDAQVPLWQKLWANVQALEGECRREVALPWTADCLTSEGGADVTAQLDARYSELSDKEKSVLCYFATPRRIRLTFSDDVTCGLTGDRGRGATGYATKNFGANYLSHLFRHPLSSYYQLKEQWLPTHLSDAGFSYIDWIQAQQSSGTLSAPSVLSDPHRDRVQDWLGVEGETGVWAFGFKMDNMKCEAWLEARYPVLLGVPAEHRGVLFDQARLMIAATQSCLGHLRRALRAAWSDEGKKGDTSAAERRLISDTESEFYRLIKGMAVNTSATAEGAELRAVHKDKWKKALTTSALKVFEAQAQAGDARNESLKVMRRAASAILQLGLGLRADLPIALGLATESGSGKSKRTKGRKVA